MQNNQGQDPPSPVSAMGLTTPSQQGPGKGSSQISPLSPYSGSEMETLQPVLLASKEEESRSSNLSTPPVKKASLPMTGLCCVQNAIAFVTCTHIILMALGL